MKLIWTREHFLSLESNEIESYYMFLNNKYKLN